MSEVAAAAGSSVGSLYFRFGNKERFVNEVMRRPVDAIREDISRHLADLELKATSPHEVIEAATRWFVVEFGKNQGLLRALVRRALDDPQQWQPFQKAGREFIDGALRILQRFPEVQNDDEWQRRVRVAMQMILGGVLMLLVGLATGEARRFEPHAVPRLPARPARGRLFGRGLALLRRNLSRSSLCAKLCPSAGI